MAAPVQHKVGNVTAGFMLALALLIDGIQFLLALTAIGSIVGSVMAPLAAFGFWLWFALLGVKFTGPGAARKALTGLGSLVAEFIPLINALPAVTLGVAATILIERIEEKKAALKARIGDDPKKQAAYARLQRMQAARAQRMQRAGQEREAATEERHPSA